MIIRSAIFVGTVADEHREEFDRTVRQEVIPLLRGLPGVRSADAARTLEQEDGLPGIYQTYLLRFDDRAGMETMLQSEERLAVHAVMSRILPWFDGTIVHQVAEAES